ncbi:MAG: UbiA family prenyltransferase [Bauldia sp.]
MGETTSGERRAAVEMPRAARLIRGLFLVSHPFPAFLNATAGAIFFAVAGGWATAGAARLFLSILFTHAAIGALNDALDVDLDRRTKPAKPIIRGDLWRGAALTAAAVAGAAGLLLSATFGAGTLAIAGLVLAAGVIYDLRAKGTLWSWVPYAVAIPALPVWGFLAAGRFTPLLLLSFPLGALIALALNLANTIPDLAGDTAYGLRGLAHRLGERRAVAVTRASFAASMVLLALTPVGLGNQPAILLPGIGLAAILFAAMITDHAMNRSYASLKRGWYLAALIAAVLGASWVASLPTG